MPRPEPTEIRIDEYGSETHESWLLISTYNSSGTPVSVFDSDLQHQHSLTLKVQRCTRKRELNRDWLHGTETLLEARMSLSQWGALVSSTGSAGTPATLEFLVGEGMVPQAPFESRFNESYQEVREAGTKALNHVKEDYDKVMAAFETGGKKALREALRDLGFAINNAPANMEFSAKSMTEYVEKVTNKARADIEAMVLAAVERGELSEMATPFQLERGEEG